MALLIYYKFVIRKQPETILSPFREEKSLVYHCVSRVVNREFVFGGELLEIFVLLMKTLRSVLRSTASVLLRVMSKHFARHPQVIINIDYQTVTKEQQRNRQHINHENTKDTTGATEPPTSCILET